MANIEFCSNTTAQSQGRPPQRLRRRANMPKSGLKQEDPVYAKLFAEGGTTMAWDRLKRFLGLQEESAPQIPDECFDSLAFILASSYVARPTASGYDRHSLNHSLVFGTLENLNNETVHYSYCAGGSRLR